MSGVASCRCVRPIFTMPSNAFDFLSRVSRSGAQRRHEVLDDSVCRGDVHRGREHVVRRLPAVHVVVRVHEALLAALAAHQLACAVGDHLVQVHVGLRAGPRLLDGEREFVQMLAVDRSRRRPDDRARLRGVEHLQLQVHLGGRALHDGERRDQFRRPCLSLDSLEILQGAVRLRAPTALRSARRSRRTCPSPSAHRPSATSVMASTLLQSCSSTGSIVRRPVSVFR